jgi:hypothetical protein
MHSYVRMGMRVGNGQNIATTPTRAQYFGPCLFLVPVLELDILDKGRKFLLFFPIWSLVKPISRQEQNAVLFPFLVPGLLIFLDKGRKFLLLFQSGLWSSQYLDKSKNIVSFLFLVSGLIIFQTRAESFSSSFRSGLWSSQYLDKSKMQFHFLFWSLVCKYFRQRQKVSPFLSYLVSGVANI